MIRTFVYRVFFPWQFHFSDFFPSLNQFIICIGILKKKNHNMLAPHHQDDMTRVSVELKPNLHLPLASWVSETSNPIGVGIQPTVMWRECKLMLFMGPIYYPPVNYSNPAMEIGILLTIIHLPCTGHLWTTKIQKCWSNYIGFSYPNKPLKKKGKQIMKSASSVINHRLFMRFLSVPSGDTHSRPACTLPGPSL